MTAPLDLELAAVDLDLAASIVRESERLCLNDQLPDSVRAALLAVESLEDAVVQLVELMRRGGASWQDVAEAAGITRSGAHRKWGDKTTT